MGEDEKEIKSTTRSSDKYFGDMIERIAKSMVKKINEPPSVKDSVLELHAKRMVAYGYDFTPDTLRILSDYLKGYNLWLCGNVGVGKTFFFECINKIRKSRQFSQIVKLSMIETQGWRMDHARDWVNENLEYDVLIDDVGTEPVMKSFGQEAELFPYLIEMRMKTSRRTHLTSNLDIVDIRKRYGERVVDRFVQMFKMEVIKARKSRRVLKPWKRPDGDEGVL